LSPPRATRARREHAANRVQRLFRLAFLDEAETALIRTTPTMTPLSTQCSAGVVASIFCMGVAACAPRHPGCARQLTAPCRGQKWEQSIALDRARACQRSNERLPAGSRPKKRGALRPLEPSGEESG